MNCPPDAEAETASGFRSVVSTTQSKRKHRGTGRHFLILFAVAGTISRWTVGLIGTSRINLRAYTLGNGNIW